MWQRLLCFLVDHKADVTVPTRCERCGAWFDPEEQERRKAEAQTFGM